MSINPGEGGDKTSSFPPTTQKEEKYLFIGENQEEQNHFSSSSSSSNVGRSVRRALFVILLVCFLGSFWVAFSCRNDHVSSSSQQNGNSFGSESGSGSVFNVESETPSFSFVPSSLLATGFAQDTTTTNSLSSSNLGEEKILRSPKKSEVVLNEFVPYSHQLPWVELYNPKDEPFSLDGYFLSLKTTETAQQNLELKGTIQPKGFATFDLSFSYPNNTGGQLMLFDPPREWPLDVLSFGEVKKHVLERGGVEVGEAYSRKPDGALWSESLNPNPRRGLSVVARDEPLRTWGGGFEIHVFNVGQGDSQLIVFPSGYSILVDVFESHWQSDAGAQAVAARVRAILGTNHVNVGVISHLHMDHLGYTYSGGFWALLEEPYGLTFDKIIDRNAGVFVDRNGDGECDPNEDIKWYNVGTSSGTATKWICYATNPVKERIYPIREVARLCDSSQIPVPDEGASVKIITTDAEGAAMVGGEPVPGDHHASSLPPSENDFSVGLLIRFGDIEYVTCGDLDGEYSSSSFGYTYNDIESIVAPRVGEIDIYHMNHHGSAHSSSSLWLSVLRPTISVGSCGTDNTFGHPDQSTLDRLNIAESDIYLTSDCDLTHNYGDAVRANSDIVIRANEAGNRFTVWTMEGANAVDYEAKSKAGKVAPCP